VEQNGDALFKGERVFSPYCPSIAYLDSPVPTIPASLMAHQRQRGEETPSHPGGLSQKGRQRLEEYRKSREKLKGT
jgi:hypothetical protein